MARTPDDRLPTLLASWLAGYASPNTRAAYAADLRHFTAWCTDCRLDPLATDADDVAGYRRACEQAGARSPTVARRLSAITSFRSFASTTGAADPYAPVARPEVAAPRDRAALADAEIASLLRSADAVADRSGVLLRLLVLDGLRVGEAARADAADLSGRPPSVALRVSGRSIVLHPETATALAAYLGRRRSGPLLCGEVRGREGDRLTRFGVDYLVRQVAQLAGLDGRVTANALRRRYVVQSYAAGDGVDAIRDHLGHRDARTTRRHLGG
jgi:integrase/recombinase XerD